MKSLKLDHAQAQQPMLEHSKVGGEKNKWSIAPKTEKNLSLSSPSSSFSLPSRKSPTYDIFTILYPVYLYLLLPSDILNLSIDWFCIGEQEKRSSGSLGEDSDSLLVHSLLLHGFSLLRVIHSTTVQIPQQQETPILLPKLTTTVVVSHPLSLCFVYHLWEVNSHG